MARDFTVVLCVAQQKQYNNRSPSQEHFWQKCPFLNSEILFLHMHSELWRSWKVTFLTFYQSQKTKVTHLFPVVFNLHAKLLAKAA